MSPTDDFTTEEEYLVNEPQAEYKSEFRDGRTIAMSGASFAHNLIVQNLAAELVKQLKGRPCRVVGSDTRVKVAAAHFYTYPDLSVVCGKPSFDRRDLWALVNPTVIVEVLSPSTQAYDRGEKFEYYTKLPSLREYVLVEQDPRVEHYSLGEDGERACTRATGLGAILELIIDCRVYLQDIYDKVDL